MAARLAARQYSVSPSVNDRHCASFGGCDTKRGNSIRHCDFRKYAVHPERSVAN